MAAVALAAVAAVAAGDDGLFSCGSGINMAVLLAATAGHHRCLLRGLWSL